MPKAPDVYVGCEGPNGDGDVEPSASPRLAGLMLAGMLRLGPLCLPIFAASPGHAQEGGASQPAVGLLGANVRKAADGVLGLLGFSVVPDGTASAIQISRGGGENDVGVTLGQFGAGFTASESFPLYLEG